MTARLLILCGAGALAGTCAALALSAARRGVPLARVASASTHLVDGRDAAEDAAPSIGRTGGGILINTGAALFWGSIAATAIRAMAPIGRGGRLLAGVSTAALAGLVDYGLLPRRLSPGWERVLPASDVAMGLVGMGLGIAAGALLDEHLEQRDAFY